MHITRYTFILKTGEGLTNQINIYKEYPSFAARDGDMNKLDRAIVAGHMLTLEDSGTVFKVPGDNVAFYMSTTDSPGLIDQNE